MTAWSFRRAELSRRSERTAGSSCAARMAPASRACGHSTASKAAQIPMQAIAEPIRILKNPVFPAYSKLVCRFYDTTAPTKGGLLWDDKIVSNLHEKMSSRGCGGILGMNESGQYGAGDLNVPRVVDWVGVLCNRGCILCRIMRLWILT